jgi:subtilisin family serine protease
MKSTQLLVVATLALMLVNLTLSIPSSYHAVVMLQQVSSPNGEISVLAESQYTLTESDVQRLSEYGLVTTVAGPVAVVHTRTSLLDEMSRLPFLIRIQKSYPLSVQLDKSVPDIGAPSVWDFVKDPSGRNVTGAGVIVGFVDTGIDVTHPDFTFPNGSTKILYVWDQTTSGHPPTGFGYGYECTSVDIEARTCPEVDTFGHGTHVVGIAASSGMATGNYTGVAPGARIIFVKSGNQVCGGESWNFDTNNILDGINYIVTKAAQLKMRAVVNLSLGGNIGAHDGTDPFERALDAFVDAGTPIVVAAGNAAEDDDHVSGQLAQGQSVTVNLELRQSTVDVAVDIWYSPNDQIDATVTTPDGTTYPIQPHNGWLGTQFGELNTTTASFDHGNELYVEANSTNNLTETGWSITLNGTRIVDQGKWDAWTDSAACTFPGSYFLSGDGYSVDPQDTIGIPGTARNVVTVGAYVSKTSWKGMDGQVYGQNDITVGGIASFSSLGPTRDGRVKPDIVAPGEDIASARSSAIHSSPSDPDKYHRMLGGTSMATPHVTGMIALMLQYIPNLPATEIPNILRQTARLDVNTGPPGADSTTWGYGKADARTATGFYRLTLDLTKPPPQLKHSTLNLATATNASFVVSDGTWFSFYFPKGSTLTVNKVNYSARSQDTMYALNENGFNVTGNSFRRLNFTLEYLLTIDSQIGPTFGGGWHEENSTVQLVAPDNVPAQGVMGLLGAQYIFVHWVTSDGEPISNTIVMDGPKTVIPLYVFSFPETTLLGVIFTSMVVVIVAIVLARKRLS